MARPLLDKPEYDAVSHLGEVRAWSTPSRSEGSACTVMGSSLARLMNVDHSVLR